MLEVSPAQLETLTNARWTREVADFVQEYFPEAAGKVPREELLARVAAGLKAARSYLLVRQRDQLQYICLLMVHGPDFAERTDLVPSFADLYGEDFSKALEKYFGSAKEH